MQEVQAMRAVNNKRAGEQGAAALLVVIFSILLLLTVSVGFIRLVVRDQQRSIDDELSRGAYDAALAGVEDGKRVLQACIGQSNADACSALAPPNNTKCNTVHTAKILSAADSSANEDEVFIKSNSGTAAQTFDQAYTCVKIQRDTDRYNRTLLADNSQIIPLNTAGSFEEVNVSWYQRPASLPTVNLPNTTVLPALDEWAPVGEVRPPILRVQLIQYNDGAFNLEHFDETRGSSTLYLYPATAGAANLDFAADARRTDPNDLLKQVSCSPTSISYVCNVTISLPDPVGGSQASRKAYLRITSIYADTQYSIQAVGTQFHDVQPTIDSTGRASDVFRRIKANVEMESPFNMYPRATVDITKNFCKDFSVSSTTYTPGTCVSSAP